ncbi:MAG TPA: NADH-quinone oxidoreductase subunit NuoF [Leptospiraceae bacterium]|nr:NADH-quinone oxidoreductase subunit NuoF [Leptospiraceae bacterium]HMZ57856.1 NADH-quinone oxidoreductase subunit NuoF [Leptospiraceae bacterium]HNF13353.1 NADH-quinone oxidoreductase subunit NuoF [Leptospiraceae bacterium]HNF24849.1 NADH-quinone oxidoreductase subunit NuoF [Leptospiraceae bacterium]HNH06986.1 NADH-quinone oxidoreductase subunit NuoF [Leptospiraceae bacterium]
MAELKILTKHRGEKDTHTISHYQSVGGYTAVKKALSMQGDDIVATVKNSGLRGRGGAGFPTGMKWSFIPKNINKPKYLLCNGDEGEPGTFKDRVLLEEFPHAMIEGMIIAAKAIDSHQGYIYIRGEYHKSISRVEQAINEAYAAGLLGKNIQGSGFDFELCVYQGAGAYICGEETALINSLEGRRGHPRLKPPFPAVSGLYGCPTVVNNVETFSAVPHIINNGAEWYAKIGTPKSTGTRLFSVSGPVKKPGVYEIPLGTPLMTLINDLCGGMADGKKLRGIIPGGSSVPILTAEECKTANMDFESMAEHKTMLGSGAVIVLAEDTDIVETTFRLAEFYAHESCGQCTPCREGTHWVADLLHKIRDGHGTKKDLELILSLTVNMEGGTTICPLADACVGAVRPTIQKYRPEFEARLKG